MKETPVLFTGAMVRAILEGRKTQTRRVIKPRIQLRRSLRSDLPFDNKIATLGDRNAKMNQHGAVSVLNSDGDWIGVKPGEFDWICPYAKGRTVLADNGRGKHWLIPVSDTVLYVRETWYPDDFTCGNWEQARRLSPGCTDEQILVEWRRTLEYRADHRCADWEAGCPCSDDDGRSSWRPSIHMPKWAARLWLRVTDVRVERLQEISNDDARAEGVMIKELEINDGIGGTPHCRFTRLWDSINAKRGFGWGTDPWVWVVTFEPTDAP